MRNKRMQEKLKAGHAIDIGKCQRFGRYYILDEVIEGKDYCDAENEAWIWSIGRRKSDGVILASCAGDLYRNPAFECLWLR